MGHFLKNGIDNVLELFSIYLMYSNQIFNLRDGGTFLRNHCGTNYCVFLKIC